MAGGSGEVGQGPGVVAHIGYFFSHLIQLVIYEATLDVDNYI